MAPRAVCVSTATADGAALYHARFDRDEVVRVLRDAFTDPDVLVFGANTAYDAAVVMEEWPELRAPLFEAYAAGRVRDVQVDERLIDIARGELNGAWYASGGGRKKEKRGYSLAALESKYMGRDRSLTKHDTGAWRLRYGTLIDTPLDEWDEEAVGYAIADAEGTLRVAEAQARGKYRPPDAAEQSRASFALHLMSCWGAKTDPEMIRKLEGMTVERFAEVTRALQKAGLVRSNGTRDTKTAKDRIAKVYAALGLPTPITDTGKEKVDEGGSAEGFESLDEEACEGSGDPILEMYAERVKLQSIVDTHIPALWLGTETPIQPSYNVLVESGRTSCTKGRKGGPTNGYQVQNVRRAPGLRECFTARPGTYYADADFSGLELCTVAQVCKTVLGRSALGDALNAGMDVHLAMGAELLGIKYAEAVERKHEKKVKDARQASKVCNFGFPGGLGAGGFMGFAWAGHRMRFTEEEAKDLKAKWLKRWPEFRAYFDHVSTYLDVETDRYYAPQLFSKRLRGDMPYTAACNTFFQGLGADGAKNACWEVARASYDETKRSPLFGFRSIFFVHDQIVGETPVDVAHEQAVELGRVMVDACNVYLPDVPVKCEPCLSKHWTKDAVAVYDAPPKDGGRLLPWDLARDQKVRAWYADGKPVKW